MFQRVLLLSLLLIVVARNPIVHGFFLQVADEQEVEVISNPHDKRHNKAECSGPLLDKLLEPYQLIVTPMVTQVGSFQELTYAKIMGYPVPVYRMQQPARISAEELEFQMVLVKELSSFSGTLIKEVPVPIEKAMDSWFPGFYWTPIIMSCGDAVAVGDSNHNWQHVGWKFTKVPNDNLQTTRDTTPSSSQLPSFYALVVRLDQKEKTEGIRVGGFKAPGWMVGAVFAT